MTIALRAPSIVFLVRYPRLASAPLNHAGANSGHCHPEKALERAVPESKGTEQLRAKWKTSACPLKSGGRPNYCTVILLAKFWFAVAAKIHLQRESRPTQAQSESQLRSILDNGHDAE